MTSLNISLPESLRDFVDQKVGGEGYGSASEYIRELIRQDQKRSAEAKLEALLLEGLDSGAGIEVTAEYWERKRKALAARHARVAEKQG